MSEAKRSTPRVATSSTALASSRRAKLTLLALFLGYMGVYLCRKNLGATFPDLTKQFGANKTQLGRIASIGTAFYAVGKALGGPAVDRIGGRAGFLFALYGVAIFAALSSASPGLAVLTLMYAFNRGVGALGWPAAMKLVPTWFSSGFGKVVGILSVSYALGGAASSALSSGVIASGGGWRSLLLIPGLCLALIGLGSVALVRNGPLEPQLVADVRPTRHVLLSLIVNPKFLIVCGLSFSLTLFRESFAIWSVDFLVSIAGNDSIAKATLKSAWFDLAGAAAILITGFGYDRTSERARPWAMAGCLALLAAVLMALPTLDAGHPVHVALLMCGAGLLVYAPYSLLAGVFAIECGGTAAVAAASGFIDCIGYVGGILAGEALGRVLDYGGYRVGFECLAAIAAVSAILALFLGVRPTTPVNHDSAAL